MTGEGTDLRLGIEGRTFIAADGEHNMPDGEFFTGPVEDSAEGEITFHLPATYAGREVSGVRFRFEGGRVVDATAEKGEDFLIEMLDTDDGARRLGELGIGTNYGITAAPARSCSTRRSAAPSISPSAALIPRPAASTNRRSTGT